MTMAGARELGSTVSIAPTRQMSLMLVGPLPPPPGGMANQTRQLARLLAEEGLTVEVVRTNMPFTPQWIGHFKGLRALFRLGPYMCRLFAAAGRADIAHIMANSGWAWHLFAAPAIWIARARGCAVIVNYRGGDAETFFAREFGLVRPTLNRAAAVVVPSMFLAEIFARRGVETRVVPNIVNLELFTPAVEPATDPHIVVTRNLEPIYDIATALRALAIVRQTIPAARMTVAGIGPTLAGLQALAKELCLGESVSFIGRVENTELPALYRSARVSLNPSLVDNTPISVLEALASGVPVVSTSVGGVPFLVEHDRTALLVPAGDPPAMAAAILRVLESPELARRLAASGRVESLRYTWAEARARILTVYDNAAGPLT